MIGGLQGKEWKFIQKYLKEKISCGVGRTEEISHHAWASVKFAQGEGVMRISHKGKVLCEFRTSLGCCAKFAHAWCTCLPKAISSLFQLQIVHGLKRWIFNFLSFQMVYIMQKMDFGKCSKSVKEDCSCCPLFFSVFLLCFSPLLGLS